MKRFFSVIPSEVILHTLLYTELKDIPNLVAVNKIFKNLIDDDNFWKEVAKRYGDITVIKKPKDNHKIFVKNITTFGTSYFKQLFIKNPFSGASGVGKKKKHLLKFILHGEMGIGKSKLMDRYVLKKFTERYKATIGADFLTKEKKFWNFEALLQIWDTAGQERFQSLGNSFFRGADIFLFCFDMTNKNYVDILEKNVKKVEDVIDEEGLLKSTCIFVGLKYDLKDQLQVENAEMLKLCATLKKYRPHFVFCSSKTGFNVDELFEFAVRKDFHSSKGKYEDILSEIVVPK